jgi:hypothetical protein
MKGQCDEHGCKEMLCGCPVSELEDVGAFSEQIRAKDKWISELLDEVEKLTLKLEEQEFGL